MHHLHVGAIACLEVADENVAFLVRKTFEFDVCRKKIGAVLAYEKVCCAGGSCLRWGL